MEHEIMSDIEYDLMVNFKSIENEKYANKVKETIEVCSHEMSHHMQTGFSSDDAMHAGDLILISQKSRSHSLVHRKVLISAVYAFLLFLSQSNSLAIFQLRRFKVTDQC